MNKKGFTLVEMLAVIVVILLVALVAFPALNNTIKSNQTDSYNSKVNDIILAAETYASNVGGELVQVSVSTLQKYGYIGSKLTNPIDNTTMSGCVYKVSGTTIYKENDCDTIINMESTSGIQLYNVYEDGTPIYFNVSTGKTCLASEAVSTTNTKTGCMKFYTFGDNNTSRTVNMILDHNTTANNVLWAASVKTAGPTTAYTQLKSDTSRWLGVETQTNYQYTNSSTSYTVKYGDDNANARFITANEVAKITGNTSFNSSTSTDDAHFYFDSNSITQTAKSQGASKYAWLYHYTYGCAANGCNRSEERRV